MGFLREVKGWFSAKRKLMPLARDWLKWRPMKYKVDGERNEYKRELRGTDRDLGFEGSVSIRSR